MKSLKCLLLGSATVLVVATGVRAADMPQAEEVEYVKVCDTYGVGFWYIPGTDTCIKLGGYVRAQVYVHGSNIAEDNWGGNPFVIDSENDDDFDEFDENFHNDTFNLYTRGLINFDARTETAYGTLRSFVQIRGNAVDQDNPSVQLDLAFLQFAGFTAGLSPSFLDFATNSYFGDHVGDWNHDTPLFGYTYQLGGGVSFNIAIESGDRADTSAADFTARGVDSELDIIADLDGDGVLGDDEIADYDNFAFYGGDETRTELPDLVASVRVDQGWGEAMLGGVVRQVKGRAEVDDIDDADDVIVIDDNDTPNNPDDDVEIPALTVDGTESYQEIGWAILGGLKVNLPMIEKGDYIVLRAGYGQGASRYVVNAFDLFDSDFLASGRKNAAPEAVFSGDIEEGTDDFETTTAFSLYAGFTHFWTPEIRSNFTASYAGGDFNYDDTDWSVLTASANVIWSPVKDLDVGLELLYSARDFDDNAALVLTDDDDSDGSDDGFGAIFRVQRNFGGK